MSISPVNKPNARPVQFIFGLLATLIAWEAFAQATAAIIFAEGVQQKQNTLELEQVPASQSFQLEPVNPKEVFNCTEQVHVVLAISEIGPGDYWVEMQWVEPGGEVLKSSKGQIGVPLEQQIVYLSSSIRLESTGDVVTEDFPYIGNWSVRVNLNDAAIGEGQFFMECLPPDS